MYYGFWGLISCFNNILNSINNLSLTIENDLLVNLLFARQIKPLPALEDLPWPKDQEKQFQKLFPEDFCFRI